MDFKKDFIWGAATSSYQIEGGQKEDGKGDHIWNIFCREPDRVYENQTADIACDHYHRYKEDVEIMADLGLDAYRFSIDWTRIMPEGKGEVNEKGLAFYDRLIDSLLEKNITPYITLFHWETPYELYKRGGWMNPDIAEWFGEYVAVLSDRYSDRVKHFFTLNEPQCFVGLGFVNGVHAPGVKLQIRDTFEMSHNVLRAHGRAVQALRAKAHQPLDIGYAPTSGVAYPATDSPEDIEAAKKVYFGAQEDLRNWHWNVAWWSDPVIFGAYPEEFLKKYEAFLPRITDADMKLISEPIDTYAQNIYNGYQVRAGKDGKPEVLKRYDGFPKTGSSWPVTPEVLYWGPRFLCERYQKPFYITENGMSCHDWVSKDGKVHDYNRIDFTQRYLDHLAKAANEYDIRGYFYWSLLDNFEWNLGYSERFGLVHVDYETQKRTWKDSAFWYRDMIKKVKESKSGNW